VRLALLLVLVGGLGAGSLAAQQDQLTRAFDMERRGNYVGAIDAYKAVLAERPTEAGALLGMERALTALNRLPEIIPLVQAAIAARPTNTAIYGLALRSWAAADRTDSARKVLDLWAQVQPQDEGPYREWANISLSRRDRQEARRTFLLARERLGRDDVLAAEVAQLALMDEDYGAAAREWAHAIQRLPGYRAAAINSLTGVPLRSHQALLQQLNTEGSLEARQLAGSLMARWGDPIGGFGVLNRALPPTPTAAIEILRQFNDLVQPLATSDARKAQGLTMEAMAGLTSGPVAARYRVEAARLYAESGDRGAARRMLSLLAADANSPRSVAADAGATLVTVLLDEGKVDDAARELDRNRAALSADQLLMLNRRLAMGWARNGNLDRADSVAMNDSTVEGFDLAGRLKLYRGDLATARTMLRMAGPYAGNRDEATSRTALLALMQPIEEDSLPELGRAMLHLEQHDTTKAVAELSDLAKSLPAEAGGAELQLQVGRLEWAQGHTVEAERSFRQAAAAKVEATVPAAALELARLLAATNRQAEGQALLEQLILDHPESAIIPQARRLLDELRGAVPRT
jgi:thioredoxin-like negative regulator of GroEL